MIINHSSQMDDKRRVCEMNDEKHGNLFKDIAQYGHGDEFFETLSTAHNVRIERIVSRGQTTPAGEYYDQDWIEYVFIVQGSAQLEIEGTVRDLRLGDWVCLGAHVKHRVVYTSTEPPCVWLAVHVCPIISIGQRCES